MKKNILYLLILSMFVSCKQSSIDPTTDESKGVSFSVSMTPPTKITSDRFSVTTFTAGDAIGVFAVKRTDPGTQVYPLASGNYADNVKLVYQSNGTWSYDNPLKTIYWQGGAPIDFYAYYPYSNSADPTNLVFNIATDQSSEAGFYASDLLCAASLNQISKNVSLVFTHALSLLQLTITSGGIGAQMNSSTQVMLNSVNQGVSLNLGTNTATTNNTQTDVKMWRVEQPTDVDYNTVFTYRAIVPSQLVVQGKKLFSFTRDNRTLSYISQADQTFDRAQVYNYNVTLSASLNPSHIYSIGDIYPYKGFPKGVVASVDLGGSSGLIVAPVELQSGQWGTSTTTMAGATSSDDGQANTSIIKALTDWRTEYPILNTIDIYGTDWYLPALNELLNISTNFETINTALDKINGTRLTDAADYWTSTENSITNSTTVTMNTILSNSTQKTVTNKVRPVCKF